MHYASLRLGISCCVINSLRLPLLSIEDSLTWKASCNPLSGLTKLHHCTFTILSDSLAHISSWHSVHSPKLNQCNRMERTWQLWGLFFHRHTQPNTLVISLGLWHMLHIHNTSGFRQGLQTLTKPLMQLVNNVSTSAFNLWPPELPQLLHLNIILQRSILE